MTPRIVGATYPLSSNDAGALGAVTLDDGRRRRRGDTIGSTTRRTRRDRMDTLDLMLARRGIRRFAREDTSLEGVQKPIGTPSAAPGGHQARPRRVVCVRNVETCTLVEDTQEWAGMLHGIPLEATDIGPGSVG